MTHPPSRRNFLNVSWQLGVGVMVSPVLAACGGGQTTQETFVEPPRIKAADGVLDYTLRMAYADLQIDGKSVHLRTYNGMIPAPTLQVRAGDVLRLRVENDLPPNPASAEPVEHLRYMNSANLHTHGLHVSPKMVGPGVFGDYVVDGPASAVQPGAVRQHEYSIVSDHPIGTSWYHPHLHGSTAIQVGSGMAGAILITGDLDDVPEIAAARDRVMIFQAPVFDADGRLESFSQVTAPDAEPPFLINGVRRPRLVLSPGEVQRWRLVNAGIANYLNLALDAHDLHLIALDSCPRRQAQVYSAQADAGLVLAPGNRADILIKAGPPGRYLLRTKPYDMGFPNPLAGDVLAELVVEGASMNMALPTADLPVSQVLRPITDDELAAHGGLRRKVVLRSVFNENGDPLSAAPAVDALDHPGDELSQWQYQTDGTFFADTAFTVGVGDGTASATPAMPQRFAPFQSHRATRQTVALDSVEEWTVYNMNAVQHPFHIHINPFQVVKIDGLPVEPYWADTIGLPKGGTAQVPTSVTFRTRFSDFTGLFVMHCHILAHEDMGMMQLVEVT
ncbi:MAG: multicopper oxidase domain-containing protein [Curvibacter lanceolatus]|jgi:FtsP/CotA-like multicopper oxidase with cupredoxin domain|uniref:multicopper oxidase family protein n=1 Tax=Curvibacter lanceolatus TaxID=86182 RepID=UPI0023534393|nr:multicopper oxidase family protein [Curvibacter lanceolatus]MBV5294836.1 multicopper oxidase domain-containing protein [Curvibacter lanceolatus]